MEGPISKFMHVQQPESYWHQPNLPTSSNAFKSPDLIELNSDTERNAKNTVEPLSYSSSQEEAETEDDGCNAVDVIHLKDALPGVYDVTSNEEESCHLLQTEDDSESSHSEHAWNSSDSAAGSSRSSNGATISDGEGNEERRSNRVKQAPLENYWDDTTDTCTQITNSGHEVGDLLNVKKNSTVLRYWDMSPEQEKYYTDQFLTLQNDLTGLVNGVVAKGFFEKSKLPLEELREIWQLADTTRDGCLDFNEFKMAMHLVVLRRHGLPIPSHFYARPPEFSLGQSSSTSLSGPLLSQYKVGTTAAGPRSTTTPKARSNEPVNLPGMSSAHHSPLATPGSNESSKNREVAQGKRPSKEWATFENEPVNFSSTCDTSGLVAPVPVRLKTPEDKLILNSSSTSASKTHQLQLKAIQRPKLSGHHPKISCGTIAPPPPPRRKTHIRSSSLDMNRLTISTELPPNVGGGGNRGGGGGGGGATDIVSSRSFLYPCHQGGAFSVYHRTGKVPRAATIHEPSSSNIPSNNSIPSTTLPTSAAAKVQLEQEVDDLKNENELLSRISAQLLEQITGLQSRRHSMAYKVHQLHGNLS